MNTKDTFLEIGRLMQSIKTKHAKHLVERYSLQGVTPSQAEILNFLHENGAQKVGDIASALEMAESNVSNICSRLEKAGFVNRNRQDDDQRVVLIELSEITPEKIAKMKHGINCFIEKFEGIATEEDINCIYMGLKRFDELLDRFHEE